MLGMQRIEICSAHSHNPILRSRGSQGTAARSCLVDWGGGGVTPGLAVTYTARACHYYWSFYSWG